MQLAELPIQEFVDGDPLGQAIIDTVQEWTEESRYQEWTPTEAETLLEAIENSKGGLLPWVRLHW